jgi:nicotinamidase-related amidase
MKTQPDSFQGTDLDRLLRERGITTLVVGGIATEYCVDATVRSAYARGYKVVLVADGHATWGNDVLTAQQVVAHHNRALMRFGAVRPAAEVSFA